MKENKTFQELIDKEYLQNKNYDKLNHRLHRTRELMCKNKSFQKLPAIDQFNHCITWFEIIKPQHKAV